MKRADHNDISSHHMASSSPSEAAPASTDSKSNANNNTNARTVHSVGRTSRSLPFPSSHVHRTQSELQLCEDQEMAERRDLTMFYRLVNGIRERHMHLVHEHHQQEQQHQQDQEQYKHNMAAVETQKSLAHIISTRHSNILDRPMFPLGHHHYESNPDERIQHSFPNRRGGGDSRCSSSQLSGVLYQAAKLASSSDPMRQQQGQPNLDLEDMAGDWSVSGFPEEEEDEEETQQQQEKASNSIHVDHHYQEQGLFVDYSQPFPSTLYEKAYDDCVEEEGIFDMDL